jgi:hypothetical protein
MYLFLRIHPFRRMRSRTSLMYLYLIVSLRISSFELCITLLSVAFLSYPPCLTFLSCIDNESWSGSKSCVGVGKIVGSQLRHMTPTSIYSVDSSHRNISCFQPKKALLHSFHLTLSHNFFTDLNFGGLQASFLITPDIQQYARN